MIFGVSLLFGAGLVASEDTVDASTVERYPGGYILKNAQQEYTGTELSNANVGLQSRGYSACMSTFGNVDNNTVYTITYDNRVQQVNIYSHRGIIENVRCSVI